MGDSSGYDPVYRPGSWPAGCSELDGSPAGRTGPSSPAARASSARTCASGLLGRGWSVLCLDNLSTGAASNVDAPARRPRLRDASWSTSRAPFDVDGPVDAVLHFASPASPMDYLQLPIETLRVGSEGTRHALDLAHAKGARFMLASTSETYGDPQVHPQPETYWGHVNPVGPRGVYDEAKRFAEAVTMAYRRTYGTDTVIARIFNTYGPRMRPRDGRAIPTFITQALRGEPLTVAGDGEQTRSVCYVDDEVEGLLRLLESGHAGPMNIGNPGELSVLKLAELVVSSDRQLVADRVRAATRGRPERAPTGHHAGHARCSAGRRRSVSRRASGARSRGSAPTPSCVGRVTDMSDAAPAQHTRTVVAPAPAAKLMVLLGVLLAVFAVYLAFSPLERTAKDGRPVAVRLRVQAAGSACAGHLRSGEHPAPMADRCSVRRRAGRRASAGSGCTAAPGAPKPSTLARTTPGRARGQRHALRLRGTSVSCRRTPTRALPAPRDRRPAERDRAPTRPGSHPLR